MLTVNGSFTSRAEARAFVAACEQDFEERLKAVSREIVITEHVKCVTLTGPTCSGKTTMARKLTDAINAAGKRAVILSIDDFFKEHAALKRVGDQVDYDSVDAIDLPYFAECVGKMLRGENTPLPRFDFVSGSRLTGEAYAYTPDDILVFEGIQAVYPEVTVLLHGYAGKSLAISVTESISVNGIVFSPEEIRLARRIVRDYHYRSASPEFTFHIWQGVRENEEANIYPYIGGCDFLINSLMAYEPFMIAPFLLPLLEEVASGSPYYAQAQSFREKFIPLKDSAVSPDFLFENSLYHEFLG